MADIDVVRKGSRTWLWIVIVLAVVLVAWWLMSRSGPGTRTTHLVPNAPHSAYSGSTIGAAEHPLARSA